MNDYRRAVAALEARELLANEPATTITLRLPRSTKDLLEALAGDSTTASALVRTAIREYLEAHAPAGSATPGVGE
jgi:hypothetical protein